MESAASSSAGYHKIVGTKYKQVRITRNLGGNNLLAKCDCGSEFIVTRSDFIAGRVWACSNCMARHSRQRISAGVNPVGMRFGRLTVIERVKSTGFAVWLCRCDCGGEIEVMRRDLTSGAVTHCRDCGGGIEQPQTPVHPAKPERACRNCAHNPITSKNQALHYCEYAEKWIDKNAICSKWQEVIQQ